VPERHFNYAIAWSKSRLRGREQKVDLRAARHEVAIARFA